MLLKGEKQKIINIKSICIIINVKINNVEKWKKTRFK
jgi:hypothetical protein